VTPHVAAIVNPRSGNGRTGRAWRLISSALTRELGPIKPHFTLSPGTPDYLPAAELTRIALKQGAQMVVAVGGDGTLNEVLNGFFEDGEMISPEAHLAVLPSGTGDDFRKTLGMSSDIDKNAALIASGASRPIDIGRITFSGANGTERMRYFINIASFGLSGEAVHALNRKHWPKSLGTSFAFLWSGLTCALTHRRNAVRFTADNGFDEIVEIGTAAICNGRYFGAGLMVAPLAQPDDGLLDITLLRETRLLPLLGLVSRLYRGAPLQADCVTQFRTHSLTATPLDAARLALEADGETLGFLPARFDILPRAITLRC